MEIDWTPSASICRRISPASHFRRISRKSSAGGRGRRGGKVTRPNQRRSRGSVQNGSFAMRMEVVDEIVSTRGFYGSASSSPGKLARRDPPGRRETLSGRSGAGSSSSRRRSSSGRWRSPDVVGAAARPALPLLGAGVVPGAPRPLRNPVPDRGVRGGGGSRLRPSSCRTTSRSSTSRSSSSGSGRTSGSSPSAPLLRPLPRLVDVGRRLRPGGPAPDREGRRRLPDAREAREGRELDSGLSRRDPVALRRRCSRSSAPGSSSPFGRACRSSRSPSRVRRTSSAPTRSGSAASRSSSASASRSRRPG